MSPQLPPLLPMTGPLVVRHAAFAVPATIYDELARILRAREYHHVFDTENGAIYMDQIALTRAPATLTAADIKPPPTFTGHLTMPGHAWLIENGKTGIELRYYQMTRDHGWTWTDNIDLALRFAREKDANDMMGVNANGWAAREHQWG